MSAGPKHEIVIIRRGGHSDHDDYHGGVWKIAFADFMTAMMAFFLVMWLISANDKTRASVARYFNPVKLVDATTQPRGLHDPKKDDSGITASPDTKESEGKSKEMAKNTSNAKAESTPPNETAAAREKRLDAALRDQPLAALAEIAAEHGTNDVQPKDVPHASAPVIGRNGGAAFRDPFTPPPPATVGEDAADELSIDAKPKNSIAPRTKATTEKGSEKPIPESALPDIKSSPAPSDAKVTDLERQLKASIKSAGRPGAGPDVEVQATKEGLLVSLTDTGSFSMFANGSAVPSKRVISMMEGVAKILASKPGGVVIRGFTDNKKFRGGRYDNWHLSLDRAQTAHYMLVRGGLSDARVASVEGLADRAAAVGIDPGSPLNRRIEILLKNDAK